MTAKISWKDERAARVSVQAHMGETHVKTQSVGRSQNPRIIDAKLQGYLS